MSIPINRAAMVADYDAKFNSMRIIRSAAVEAGAKRILAGKARYQAVSDMTDYGVPWEFIGALHYREATCNFNCCLANGQSIRRRTTIEPIGAGPWPTWEESAVWALNHDGLLTITDWSPGVCLFEGEEFNGEGYHLHGWENPYLFGGTNYYTSGKYVRDHVYDPHVVDPQIGIAALMKRVKELDAGSSVPMTIMNDFSTGKLHPVDRKAVVANSRFLKATDWYTNFCHYVGLTWAGLLAGVQQLQPFLTDWRTLTVLGILGGGYAMSQVGAFNLLRAAGQGRYTPSGLATAPAPVAPEVAA
jgi:lysozyme family protein